MGESFEWHELYIKRYLQFSHGLFIYLFFGAGQEELRLKYVTFPSIPVPKLLICHLFEAVL